MFSLLGRLKQNLLMNDHFRKYIFYAFGEMLLVVAGILIALQIDNWNVGRQQEVMLKSYLQSIARNMNEDAEELKTLHALRAARILDATRARYFLSGALKTSFDIDEIFFFNHIRVEASQNLSFNPNTSGFEALKSSGVIERLQGRDIERLLSKYYDKVNHIEDIEARLNEYVDSFTIQFALSIPHNTESWAFSDPSALPPHRFDQLQPVYAKVVNGPAARELLNSQLSAHDVMHEYDKLKRIGDAFVRIVESGSMAFEAGDEELLLTVDEERNSRKIPDFADLVVDGQLSTHHYFVSGVAADGEPIFTFRSIEKVNDSLHIVYPGSRSWAAVFLGVIGLDLDRSARDFSLFDKLVLELKGDEGGEVISLHIKDRYLQDSEAPESVEIQLTAEWQTYAIDLASFKNTDMSSLVSPLGFDFMKQPLSFSLRNARFTDQSELLGDTVKVVKHGGMGDEDSLSIDKGESDSIDFADLIVDGELSSRHYFLSHIAADGEPVFTFRSIEKVNDSLHIVYPGSRSWAAVYLGVTEVDSDRTPLDFSRFDRLALELKGYEGGEVISLHIKDRYLQDSEAPESVEIQLTAEWQTYVIDLSSFKTTDMSSLVTPLGFDFMKQPLSFSLRNVRYIEKSVGIEDVFFRSINSGNWADEDGDEEALSNDKKEREAVDFWDLVVDGQLSSKHYFVSGVAAGGERIFDSRSIEKVNESLHIVYPGSRSWAALYLGVLEVDSNRTSLDFSRFDKLILELKGDKGGEIISLHIKDSHLQDIKIPESVEIQVTADWQTYAIDLSSFKTTDMSSLVTPLGFDFLKEPLSFSLRNARFADQSEVLGDAVKVVEHVRKVGGDPLSNDKVKSDALGFSNLIVDGQLSASHYFLSGIAADGEPIFGADSIETVSDSLHIVYPGSQSWAAVFLGVIVVDSDRTSLDFSRFDKLILELKGEKGGEIISLHIKDSHLQDNELPERIEIQVTADWQTYAIDLSSFKTTDMSSLVTPLGFDFWKEPQSFSLRNARYIESD